MLFRSFVALCRRHQLELAPDALPLLRKRIEAIPRDRAFGNARAVRNLFEEAIGRQADRLAQLETVTDSDLQTLVAGDLG